MKKIIILFLCGLLGACSPKTFAPADQSLQRMQQKVPGITMERARDGYNLYSAKCASCHRLYDPAKYTLAKWEPILNKMIPRAKITDWASQKLIRDYVYAAAAD